MNLMRRPCMALVHVPRPPDPLAWVARAQQAASDLWHFWDAFPDDCNDWEYCGGEW